MRLSVNQSSLAKALSIVNRAVSNRTTMPILGNVLLDATGDGLRLAATNREIGINCWIAADVEESGSTTIPARLLSEFINSLPNERVNMALQQPMEMLRLTCAKHSANIKGINAFEFPLIPSYQPESTDTDAPVVAGDVYTVAPNALAALIDSVTFAASQDENRPTLTGVETTFDDGRLTMAATDGYRLSMRSVEASTGEKTTIIIPGRSLSEVSRIAADATGEITAIVSANRNQVLFSATSAKEWQRVDIICELIDARFPDYRATIPKSHNTRCTVDTASLLKAVRVAMLFARDNANIIRCALRPDDSPSRGVFQVSATSAEMGDNISEIECNVEGAEINIAFDGRLLSDALSHVPTSQVTIETTQATRPGTLRPVGDSDYLMVIMPMHPPK